jgi:hypothetical protein
MICSFVVVVCIGPVDVLRPQGPLAAALDAEVDESFVEEVDEDRERLVVRNGGRRSGG